MAYMLGLGKFLLLSFDDGPAPVDALLSILDTLRQNGIRAEFFVCGASVSKYPDAARLIVSQGHSLQNHSWSHQNLTTMAKPMIQSELEDTQSIIKETTGTCPTKLRPPYGAGGWPGEHAPALHEVVESLGLTMQNWDIDTLDWDAPGGFNPERMKIIEAQLAQHKDKNTLCLLMHVRETTARDLPWLIAELQAAGFAFAPPG